MVMRGLNHGQCQFRIETGQLMAGQVIGPASSHDKREADQSRLMIADDGVLNLPVVLGHFLRDMPLVRMIN